MSTGETLGERLLRKGEALGERDLRKGGGETFARLLHMRGGDTHNRTQSYSLSLSPLPPLGHTDGSVAFFTAAQGEQFDVFVGEWRPALGIPLVLQLPARRS